MRGQVPVQDNNQSSSSYTQTHYRACHLCEAICGLEITTQGTQILSIKGDANDPLSKGFICPKATALQDLHSDPERIRTPMKRVGDQWQEISWDEAIEYTVEKLLDTQEKHGSDAVAFYRGNPTVHNYGNLTHAPQFLEIIGSKNNYSASSLDQLPQQVALYMMFGHQLFFPVPDIDRTQLFVVIGANPIASNGSVMTAPNMPKRLRALKARGGKLVVIDPRKTETAAIADRHHFVKPGSDAFLLMAIIHVLFADNLVKANPMLALADNVDAVKKAAQPFTPQLAAEKTGIAESAIKALAEELVNTEKAVVYGRMGVSTQLFGGVSLWAIQVINILIGALDREGGLLVSSPAMGYVAPGAPYAGHYATFHSRVSALPEFAGELPSVALLEEMTTPGHNQVKALMTIAGNPVMASTNANALDKAIESLDFYVAVDFYINATTRHADIILPPTSPLEHDHYDVAILPLAVRNVARFNAPVFDPPPGAWHDWEIFNALTAKVAEKKGLQYQPLPSPDNFVAAGIEAGYWGAQNKPHVALTLEKIKAAPHGIDLGDIAPGIAERIPSDSGRINLGPQVYLDDLERLKDAAEPASSALLLVGRRHVRSNNSWMQNYHRLVKGKPRWMLLMHPDDLAERNLSDGDIVVIESRVGRLTTTVMATEDIMRGVICLPHGWGQSADGKMLADAQDRIGVNYNQLTDDKLYDRVSANAALNGVPVSVYAA